jgi:hypothetical protein
MSNISNIEYKINKYNKKYTNTDNLESKAIYCLKLSEHIDKQSGGNTQISNLNEKLDQIDNKLSDSNKLYELVKKHDLIMNKIIGINYDPKNDLVDYFYQTIKKN